MGKLQDFCLNITDGEHRSCASYKDGTHYMLNNNNISEDGISIRKSDRRISNHDYERVQRRLQLERGDVVVSTCGTIGKVQVIEEDDPDYIFSRSVAIIKCDMKKLLPEFLKYYLMQSEIQQRLVAFATGMPSHICLSDLKELEVNIPAISKQHEVVDRLNLLTRKIQNNFEILKEIGEVAKELYQYWFETKNGQNGWTNGKIGDLIRLMDGKTCHCRENGDYPVYTSGGITKYVSQYMDNGPALIVPRKGSLGNIQYAMSPFWASDTVFFAREIIPNASIYLYYYMMQYCDLWRLNTGTIIPSLTKAAVYSVNVTIPSKETLVKFAKAVQMIIKTEVCARKENQQLMLLRGTMIDMLMSELKRN